MTTFTVTGGRPLRGRITVPGDKSISHRALILAALAEGTSVVRGLSDGDDVARTRAAIEAMGAGVEGDKIAGGRSRLHEPDDVLDMGNSGTGIRLLAGLCAGLPWMTVLTGDASIRRRPMLRIREPLHEMGARIFTRRGHLAPLVIMRADLHGIDIGTVVLSAQVKSAILLAGLSAEGPTRVRQTVATRPHTEELLALAGADIEVAAEGRDVRLRPGPLAPFELDVPGDPSQAAFWVVAACLVPGSDVVVDDVYLGPTRSAFIDVLVRMGADVEQTGPAQVRARYSPDLHGTEVGGDEISGLIDEIPVLAVAAARAEGDTVFRDAGELRVKESDRIATTTAGLSAMGARYELTNDGFVVTGPDTLHGALTTSHGDHRIAMALAVAGLAAEGTTEIDGWEAVATSYPGFAVRPGAAVRVVAIDGPVGSGKSTVAKAVAKRLDLPYLESGAMYRVVAWAAVERGIDPEDEGAITELAAGLDMEVGERVTVAGKDVTAQLRSPEVGRAVSTVAATAGVRTELVRRQREWVEAHGGAVVEGRDIGSVVFPDADVKVFLTASAAERARRREQDETADDLARRDLLDSTRSVSPLIVPQGAVVVDTTGRAIDDVVDEIVGMLEQ